MKGSMATPEDDGAHGSEDAVLSRLVAQAAELMTGQMAEDFDTEANRARFFAWLAGHTAAQRTQIMLARGSIAGTVAHAARMEGAMVASGETAWETPQQLSSPRPTGPTVQRLVLGSHLRRLREQAGMTTERAAASIRGSRSKINRMEHGRVGLKERDIADLLNLYGVGKGTEREALLNLARGDHRPGWWKEYSDILPHWVEPYIGLEAAASFIREFELQCVPGLLQIEDYAREVIRLGNPPSEDEVVRRAKARISRQEIFLRDDPPKIWAVLDEGALRRHIGGPQVMRAQLRHLIDMCDRPNVTLQILPFSAGAHRAMGGSFTILRYTEPHLRDVVYIEQLTSALYLDKRTEVDAYLDVIEEVCLQAEPSIKTPDFLRRLLQEVLS
jgi:transcriptional regulator with XRE-family HTH domain